MLRQSLSQTKTVAKIGKKHILYLNININKYIYIHLETDLRQKKIHFRTKKRKKKIDSVVFAF